MGPTTARTWARVWTRRSVPAAVGAVLLLGAVACYAPAGRAGHVRVVPNPAQWQRVAPEGSGFAISMPGQPELEQDVDPDFDGTPIRRTVGKLLAQGTAVFGFVILEAPGGFVSDPYADAREAARGGAKDDDGVVRHEREYEDRGFVVSERIVDLRGEGVVLYMRMYAGKTRAYGAFMAMPHQSEQSAKSLIDAYFESLELDPRQAVTPVGSGRLTPDRWEFIYPPEADFAIRVPGSARGVEGEGKFGGEEVHVRKYGVQNDEGTEVFEVVVTSFGDGPPTGAIGMARSGWERDGYQVEPRGFVHARGFGGRTLVYRNDREEVHVDYYTTLSRLYEVRVRLPHGDEPAMAQARTWFRDSFRIF